MGKAEGLKKKKKYEKGGIKRYVQGDQEIGKITREIEREKVKKKKRKERKKGEIINQK